MLVENTWDAPMVHIAHVDCIPLMPRMESEHWKGHKEKVTWVKEEGDKYLAQEVMGDE